MDLDKAYENQIKNIEASTGKTLAEFENILAATGLAKYGERREHLKSLGLSHGNANAIVRALSKDSAAEGESDPLDALYVGPKAALRPIHEKLMAAISEFGAFEEAQKKGYVALRRKKQFAMVGPATNSRIEIGLNLKGREGNDRFVSQPPGGMCQFKIRLGEVAEVDQELVEWLRLAYDGS